MLRSRLVVPLAGTCLVAAAAAPAAAQFANVPQPPAPTPYAVRFGTDSTPPPAQRDSLRAAARADLRAWVDSAAASMGIELDLPDSVEFPLDSAAIDSLAPEIGPDDARADSIRRDSVRRDSVRRDSVRRDSLRRAGPPPVASAAAGGPTRSPVPAPVPRPGDGPARLVALAPAPLVARRPG